ncbi:13957_t:CDS:1, partial [Dentiscutata heterogama]
KASIIGEVSGFQPDTDVDELTNAFSELKICQVSQSNQEAKDTSRIDKLESSISELTKVIKNMSNNKNQYIRNQPRGSSQTDWCQRQGPERVLAGSQSNQPEIRKCYSCNQEGHISRNCLMKTTSKRLDDLNKREKGIDKENMNISGADI